MNSEIKETVLTFLKGREYIFSLFHTVLGAEPTKEMLAAAGSDDSLLAIHMFDDEDNRAAEELCHVLTGSRGLDSERLDRMKSEYTRLFIGPDKLIAPPWESVYTTAERALFQESTLAVREWYRKYHYLPEGYPRVADDHISLMTHFLSLTTGKAIVCLEEGRTEECRNLLEGQKLFERNHLLNWLPKYAAEIQKSKTREFYPQFVKAMADFMAYDNQVIDELTAVLE